MPYDPFLRGRLSIEVVAWDGPAGSVPMLASTAPQEQIDRLLPHPSECDLVIGILWKGIGTPLSPDFKRADGSSPGSGTLWELEDALNAAVPPPLLLYRRVADPDDSSDPAGQLT